MCFVSMIIQAHILDGYENSNRAGTDLWNLKHVVSVTEQALLQSYNGFSVG